MSATTIEMMPELKTQICQVLLDTRRAGMPQLIATLLHDFGKCGQFGKPGYVENILSNGRQCARHFAW